MRVFLDDTPLEVQSHTVAGAIDAARAAAGALGRVVVEVKLDGREATAADLDSGTQPPPTAEEVRMVTADPVALVRYSMQEVCAAVPDLRAAQAAAARSLQAGEIEAGLTSLGEALAMWENLRRVIDDGPRLVGIRLDTVNVGDEDAAAAVARLAAPLSRVQEALKAQDWSTVADTLEGELDDAAAEWQTILGALDDRLGESR